MYVPSMDLIELVNARLQNFGALFIYHLIYIESFQNRHLQREYWQQINKNCSGNEWQTMPWR